jgi:YesN/AraC family two-component response regulator
VKPKLLWVSADCGGPREASVGVFERHFQIDAFLPSQMPLAQTVGDWDLICFNFDFPEMGCLKLVPQAKMRWPSAPIVMLTMQNSADLSLWALRSRVFDLLVKPLAEEEIERCLQRVHTALKARRSQSERDVQAIAAPMPPEVRYRPQLVGTPRLQAAIAHISKHYAQHICESDIAELCEMSPSRFCREFKSAFGVTFLEHLCGYRIAQAKRLLMNPGMSVSDVAAAVGFADPSYFARVFRKESGTRPSEYREAVLGRCADETEDDSSEAIRAEA